MKTILHLCADIGSDSAIYADNGYNVILIGKDIGVENYTPPKDVYGVFANPVCTHFSNLKSFNKEKPKAETDGMFLVNHCLRIIKECKPKFWVLENPACGSLKKFIGKPRHIYQPWQYGSPWTKKTALWGEFNIPSPIYNTFSDVPERHDVWVRKGRKPSLVWLHKNDINKIPEFLRFKDKVNDDMSLRSLCSQKFAKAFFDVNK